MRDHFLKNSCCARSAGPTAAPPPPAGKRQSHQVTSSSGRHTSQQPRSPLSSPRCPLRSARLCSARQLSFDPDERECECVSAVFGRSVDPSVCGIRVGEGEENCTGRHAAFGNRNLDAASLLRRWSNTVEENSPARFVVIVSLGVSAAFERTNIGTKPE